MRGLGGPNVPWRSVPVEECGVGAAIVEFEIAIEAKPPVRVMRGSPLTSAMRVLLPTVSPCLMVIAVYCPSPL